MSRLLTEKEKRILEEAPELMAKVEAGELRHEEGDPNPLLLLAHVLERGREPAFA